jgi:hypothetical protein
MPEQTVTIIIKEPRKRRPRKRRSDEVDKDVKIMGLYW